MALWLASLALLLSWAVPSAVRAAQIGNCSRIVHSTCCGTVPLPYELADGFLSDDFATVGEALRELDKRKVAYACNESSTWLDQHFSFYKAPRSFSSKQFLSLISRSNVVIAGDSMARQLFVELTSALALHETGFAAASNSSREGREEAVARFHSNERVHVTAFYGNHNATITFCSDVFLMFLTTNDYNSCIDSSRNANIWVISIGTWFKPSLHMSNNASYFEAMRGQLNSLSVIARQARSAIKHHNPHALVIWNLHAHVGSSDEWSILPEFYPEGRGAGPLDYLDGRLWTNSSLEAPWVFPYNSVLRQMAEHHCDLLLDAYSLSHKYLQRFPGQRVHVDLTHYCPGSVARGEIWLLQQLLARSLSAHGHLRGMHAHYSHRCRHSYYVSTLNETLAQIRAEELVEAAAEVRSSCLTPPPWNATFN